ncbi:MAG: hypothetical protein QXG03_08025 [Halalkalicoccus sp.]
MSTGVTRYEPPETIDEQVIGFAGEPGAGRTTVATLVADRLAERSAVAVEGEAARVIGPAPEPDREATDGLDIDWTVADLPAGPEALAARADALDTAFVVATPGGLDEVRRYERVAARFDLDAFLVVTRVTEADRDRLRAYEGLDLAEYFHEDEGIEAAMAAGEIPALSEWTVEAVLIESLQPERLDREAALAALDDGRRSVVNVEVADRRRVPDLLAAFEAAGHRGAYFRCNCRCHDGHVLARSVQRDG